MVMRNRHDGADTPGWWDDLPPALRKRFANQVHLIPDADDASQRFPVGNDPLPYRPGVIGGLSWLVACFLAVAFANLIFLLIALSYLFGTGPLAK